MLARIANQASGEAGPIHGVVTGGSRGIGAAIVRRLADDGAEVAFSYVDSSEKAESLFKDFESKGLRGLAIKADQLDAAQVTHLVNFTPVTLGQLDILVNNAGAYVTGVAGDAAADITAFNRQFAVNVQGVATAVRTAVPLLSDGGRIISIGSVFGSRSPIPGIGDYSASKAAIAAYTRAGARDLGLAQLRPISCSRAPSTLR